MCSSPSCPLLTKCSDRVKRGKMSNKNKSDAGMYIYEDPRTGELFHYSRKGTYRKNGRTLMFKGKAHILNRVQDSQDHNS